MIGLPSLHTLDGAQSSRIWLATEATDMRCGFDRLAERVRAVIGQDPLSGHLFVFRSRRGDRLKILLWDQDGFLLWYKRLEAGVFQLPRGKEGVRSLELRASELAMVLDGIDVSKLKRVPRYARISEENKEKILLCETHSDCGYSKRTCGREAERPSSRSRIAGSDCPLAAPGTRATDAAGRGGNFTSEETRRPTPPGKPTAATRTTTI